jgi:hypothetical protein
MTSLFFALAAGVGLLGFAARPLASPPFHGGAPAENGAALPGASAPAIIASEVMVIHGTNGNSGIDPKLGKMTALSKPPFSSYNSYKLISHTAQPLAKGQPSLLNLPTGRQLQLVYRDLAPPQKPGASARYLVAASIQSPNGKSFLPLVEVKANPGEWFWVGGQEYQGGSLFIGIKIP